MGLLDSVFGSGDIPEYQAIDTHTGIGSVVNDPVRGVQVSLGAPYQAAVDQIMGSMLKAGGPNVAYDQPTLQAGQEASRSGAGFLEGLKTFDPMAAAEQRFAQMEDILSAGRERNRGNLEARLLRQGRLGSTGGALEQQGLEAAIEESRRKNLYDAYGQALETQKSYADIGTKLGAFGAGVQDQQLQRMLQGLSAATATEVMPLETTGYAERQAEQKYQSDMFKYQNEGGGMKDIVGGALTAVAAFYGGPAGAAAAQAVL